MNFMLLCIVYIVWLKLISNTTIIFGDSNKSWSSYYSKVFISHKKVQGAQVICLVYSKLKVKKLFYNL